MLKRFDAPSMALLLTLALFGVASVYPLHSLWGINHPAFLPQILTYLFAMVGVVVLLVIVSGHRFTNLDQFLESIKEVLFGRRPWGRLALPLLGMVLFFVLRTETHFLGDGYGWLSILGSGEGYCHKWSEPGSIFLIRQIQSLPGGYTQATALDAFRLVSIVSGAVVVFNITLTLHRPCLRPDTRTFGLITLLTSGALLLFMGYVEF